MKGRGSYIPPLYIPLEQSERLEQNSDTEDEGVVAAAVPAVSASDGHSSSSSHRRPMAISHDPTQWSSGICACFDDMPSCCIGTVCPCFLFGKNAEFLGSGTLAGSCMTHCILCGLVNCLCCIFTGGILLAMPGSMVACYACGYRKALRAKYSLQEAPCGDLTTHLCCHQCAVCQEYREIRERSGDSGSMLTFPAVTAPQVQTMESPQN